MAASHRREIEAIKEKRMCEGDIVLKKLPPGRVQLMLRVGSWKHSVGGIGLTDVVEAAMALVEKYCKEHLLNISGAKR